MIGYGQPLGERSEAKRRRGKRLRSGIAMPGNRVKLSCLNSVHESSTFRSQNY